MTNTTTVLELQNVTKKINRKTIIDQLSMKVEAGEIFGFLGPNGAGKTTTIRMIVGLMSISSGNILINNINVKQNFEKAMAQIGAIVENPEMYKFLSGYDNLRHYARMVNNVSLKRIDEVVELVGLQNRIKDKVKSYSLGMRQRLGLAQALLHKPSLLILDEPTNGLDPSGIRELRDHLRTLTKKEGIAVLVSSHLLSEMELMCDRVAIIQGGKLIDIQRVHERDNEPLSINVTFQVDQADEAKKVLTELLERDVLINENIVTVQLEHEEIPVVNKTLVNAGISVYSIKPISQSLEDKFLQITGGEEIV